MAGLGSQKSQNSKLAAPPRKTSPFAFTCPGPFPYFVFRTPHFYPPFTLRSHSVHTTFTLVHACSRYFTLFHAIFGGGGRGAIRSPIQHSEFKIQHSRHKPREPLNPHHPSRWGDAAAEPKLCSSRSVVSAAHSSPDIRTTIRDLSSRQRTFSPGNQTRGGVGHATERLQRGIQLVAGSGSQFDITFQKHGNTRRDHGKHTPDTRKKHTKTHHKHAETHENTRKKF